MAGWADEMADSINCRMGGNVPNSKLRIVRSGSTDAILATPVPQSDGMISRGAGILVVDWTDADGGLCGGPSVQAVPTTKIADRILEYLGQHQELLKMPIHLIGHSRGGSVMSRLAAALGANGIWIDQLTFLDPRPILGTCPSGSDFPAAVWGNVLFADNYYQDDLVGGISVNGTYQLNLSSIVTGDGYDCNFSLLSAFGNGIAHSQIHAYYHGTISAGCATEPTPLCVDDILIQSQWYDSPNPGGWRRRTGFYFTRTGGGDRYGAEATSGLHYRLTSSPQNNREAVTLALAGAAWPNATLKPLANYNCPADSPINFTYFYQDADSSMDVFFSLDNDTNPFNDVGNTCYQQIGSSLNHALRNTISAATIFSWTPANANSGTWYIQIKGTDAAGHVRYDYLPKPIKITTTTQAQSDLVIQNLSVTPNSGEPGSTATIAFTIRNTGLGIAYPSSANVRLNSFVTGVAANDTPLVIGVDVPQLDLNEPFAISRLVTIPQVAASGTYYVWAIVDVDNEANQSDTLDASDKAKVPITITVPPAPTAIGNYVQVFNTGTSGLRVRSPDACGTPLVGANRFDGAQGRVVAGPQPCTFDGVTYTLWKVQWSDCVVGWSAQNWLKKIAPVTITCEDHTLTVTASLPNAAEQGNTAGRFTIARTGGTQTALTVNYTIGGNAQNGIDYVSLSGAVVIPAGASSANVAVTPIEDAFGESDETVTLTLSANGAYTLGTPNSATVTIADNDSLGDITGSVTWSGEVRLAGDVRILQGGTLHIQPGTIIRCAANSDNRNVGIDGARIEIIVDGGVLDVAGTAGSPVLFTSGAVNKDRAQWSGIRVVNGDVTMRNFIIEYASTGLSFEDGSIRFQTYVVEHGTLRYCNLGFNQTTSGDAIDPFVLSDLHLTRNQTGMSISGSLDLEQCEIANNDSTGINGNGGTLTMTSCAVTNNGGNGGLSTGNQNVFLLNSEFRRNSNFGVYCYGDGNNNIQIRNCVVRENSSGIYLSTRLFVTLVGNTVSDHTGNGIEWQINYSGGLGTGGFTGNTIRNNQIGVSVGGNMPSVLAITNNDIFNNRSFEIRNQSGIAVVADRNYWGEPTSTELTQNQVNLSRIYDQRDNGSYGLVTILNSRFSPISGGGGTAPTITLHPQPQTVVAGTPASFTVAASGSTPFRYQWRKNNNPIAGATGASLVLLNVQGADAATYSVVVSNSAGIATSSGALLTVNLAPGNLATRTIAPNGPTFSVSMTVSPWAGLGFGFVEETIPSGFTATGLNAGGTFNASTGKILWGPIVDNQTYQLSYTLQPPVGFQGSRQLTGSAYFFGSSTLISGDSVVTLLPSGQAARLTLTRVSGIFAISVAGEVGRSYQVEARDSLNSGQWEPLATLNLTQSPRLYIDGDSVGKTNRFYRCVLVE